MLRGRKLLVGSVTGWLCSVFHRSLTGQVIEPRKLNPFAEPEPYTPETEEEKAYRIRRNWVVLDAFFAQMKGD